MSAAYEMAKAEALVDALDLVEHRVKRCEACGVAPVTTDRYCDPCWTGVEEDQSSRLLRRAMFDVAASSLTPFGFGG